MSVEGEFPRSARLVQRGRQSVVKRSCASTTTRGGSRRSPVRVGTGRSRSDRPARARAIQAHFTHIRHQARTGDDRASDTLYPFLAEGEGFCAATCDNLPEFRRNTRASYRTYQRDDITPGLVRMRGRAVPRRDPTDARCCSLPFVRAGTSCDSSESSTRPRLLPGSVRSARPRHHVQRTAHPASMARPPAARRYLMERRDG